MSFASVMVYVDPEQQEEGQIAGTRAEQIASIAIVAHQDGVADRNGIAAFGFGAADHGVERQKRTRQRRMLRVEVVLP